jgi:hypothetical protein
MTGAGPLNCFVSYSAGFSNEASRLTELLQEMGVDSYRPDILAGQEIRYEILGAIRAADFICLIVGEGSPSPNVAFEAGVAIGLGKPVLTLATGPNLPFDFAKGVQIIRLPSGNVASIRRDIARFVRHVRPRSSSSGRRSEPSARLTDWAQEELSRIRHVSAVRQREARLVDLIARLFEEQGSEVLREAQESARVDVDLLVWSDALVAELGGPLIVECKYYGGGSGSVLLNARHAFKHLAAYVEQSSAKLGLLVFDHDRPTNLSLSELETPEALAFFVGELLTIIGAGTFLDEIQRRRARAARLRAYRGDGG